jgi:hypothetical protein
VAFGDKVDRDRQRLVAPRLEPENRPVVVS